MGPANILYAIILMQFFHSLNCCYKTLMKRVEIEIYNFKQSKTQLFKSLQQKSAFQTNKYSTCIFVTFAAKTR